MMPEQSWWLLPLTTFLSVLLALSLMPVARKAGLVDQPGVRKVHDMPTPLTGGPALLITLAGLFAWTIALTPFTKALASGALMMFLVGLGDDRRHVATSLRFLVQIVACLLMIFWADVRLEDFGRLIIDNRLELGWLSVPITVFAAMGVINSFNLIDGMDGVAGSVFLVAAGGLALFAALLGQTQMLTLLLIAIAAVFGFLLLNARFPWNEKARLFLGDSGSMSLGFLLAWSFIYLGNDHNEAGQRAFMPMTAVWLFAVPLLDTSTQIWRRWRAGLSPFGADQRHLHHAFLRAGFTVGQTSAGIALLSLALAGVGLFFEFSGLPDYSSFWIFMFCAFIYYFYMRGAWGKQRFLGRDFIYNDFGRSQK